MRNVCFFVFAFVFLLFCPFQRYKLPSSLSLGPFSSLSQHQRVKASSHSIHCSGLHRLFGRALVSSSVLCYSGSKPWGRVIYNDHEFIWLMSLQAGKYKVREPPPMKAFWLYHSRAEGTNHMTRSRARVVLHEEVKFAFETSPRP